VVLVDNFIAPETLDPSLFDIHPHLGLISIAAAARLESHHVRIYDPKREVRFLRRSYDGEFYHHAAEDILQLSPDVIGFTTLGCSLLFAVKVGGIIKRREPDLPIILGGPHATMLDRHILETYRQFDVVVRHEAEETLPPLLRNLETRAFDAIPGVSWRDGATIRSTPGLPKIEDLDRLPIPAYELYPISDLNLDLMRIEAGRGCPFACTFCSTASFFQRDYRLKSPPRILHEMDLLHERYGTGEFKLDHDLFTVNRRKVWAFCEAVEDRDYRWRVSARTDCVDAQLLEKMARAGCVGLYFGIETGSTRMQQIADKRLKLDGVDQILDVAESLGIETTVSFITGYPEEMAEDQKQTLDMLGRCFGRPQEFCTPQFHILLPEPGTPLFAKHGNKLAYDGYVTKFNARLIGESDKRDVMSFPELYSTYYYYPSVMPRAAYTFAVDAVEAFRSVGHEILSYALRFFGGKLSELIVCFRNWAARTYPLAVINGDLALSFIKDTFGPTHHLTSLFRFGLGVASCKNVGLQQRRVDAVEPLAQECLYRMNPQSCLFADLHDCAGLLERIRALPRDAGPLNPREVGELGYYMTIVDGGHSLHCHLDPGVESILTLFKRPQGLSSALSLLREIAPGILMDEHVFDELISVGALVQFMHDEHRQRRVQP
jgi:radical SAM superfamily enzyme YgiQ (UPF0313 family)